MRGEDLMTLAATHVMDKLWDLLDAAHLAPSSHYTQPWRFRRSVARALTPAPQRFLIH
jgi:hypothetical protein